MPGLVAEQREAILKRYGGLVRTYFSQQELHDARFSYRPRLEPAEVEFHAYLRLSTLLRIGHQLPSILKRILLAPSFRQETITVDSRGKIEGRLNVPSYFKRLGKITSPPIFPNQVVRATYITPENVLAAATAHTFSSESQNLSTKLPLEGTSEGLLIRQINDSIEQALRNPALAQATRLSMPDITAEESESLFTRVAERWQTRRINNVAYLEIWQWASFYRQRGLSDDGMVTGFAYSEEFDNRLFEIFCLGCLRDAFKELGFNENMIAPLHERVKGPILEVQHPDSGLNLMVFFQKGEGVLWTDEIPREWSDIGGVPDIAFVPRSSRMPVLVVDAKNRYRGNDLEDSIADELYKILGYFQNFPHRMKVEDRGPVGGLIFLSRDGQSSIRTYQSRSGGGLVVGAFDPGQEIDLIADGARPFLEQLLGCLHVLGGRPDFSVELQKTKETTWQSLNGSNPAEIEDKVIDSVHALVAARYGSPSPALMAVSQVLELHLLGSTWHSLDKDVQNLLATAEVFWSEHQQALGMDFAPVVVELSRAMEILLSRLLIGSFNRWANAHNLTIVNPNLTLGQTRVLIELAKATAGGQKSKKAEITALADFISRHNLAEYMYGSLLGEIDIVNKQRRRAAHKEFVTSAEAGKLREQLLGVGTSNPILARMVTNISNIT